MGTTPTLGETLTIIAVILIGTLTIASAAVLMHPSTHIVVDQENVSVSLMHCGDDAVTVPDYTVTNDQHQVVTVEFGDADGDCSVIAGVELLPTVGGSHGE